MSTTELTAEQMIRLQSAQMLAGRQLTTDELVEATLKLATAISQGEGSDSGAIVLQK